MEVCASSTCIERQKVFAEADAQCGQRTERVKMELHFLENRRQEGYVTFGMPWKQGKVKKGSKYVIHTDEKELEQQSTEAAYYPDGSVKWSRHCVRVPSGAGRISLSSCKGEREKERAGGIQVKKDSDRIFVDTGVLSASFSCGGTVIQNVIANGRICCTAGELLCILENREDGADGLVRREIPYKSEVKEADIEEEGALKIVIRLKGVHKNALSGREVFPFILRFTFFKGEETIMVKHTFLFDADEKTDFIKGLGLKLYCPLKGELYNRHIKLSGDCGYLHEASQLLMSWRPRLRPEIYQKQIDGRRVVFQETLDENYEKALEDITVWGSYRLCQSSASSYSIRKSTGKKECTFIHALEGRKAAGMAAVGGEDGGLAVGLRDFREKYPSALWVDGLNNEVTELTTWIWPPDVEAMDFRHYDTVGHASAYYEGFDEAGASPYGIASTNEMIIQPFSEMILPDKRLEELEEMLNRPPLLLAEPSYYHGLKMFGEWSLPSRDTEAKRWLEEQLDAAIDFYKKEVEARGWYGLFNFGDFMHTYDRERHCWRYDMGGYAWQNTELVPTLWLWYAFLRSGREDIYHLAEAMSRHCADVDTYHIGEYKGIGSRHNVIHWGCSCKEPRIGMAGHHRIYYYLSGDLRIEDVFEDVKDGDFATLNIDPLRYFYDKESMVYPTHARTGPDWAAYTSNWLTEWERHENTLYRDKILTGIADLKQAPLQLVSGSDFEYEPQTGHLRYIGENAAGGIHLTICMGGPQIWFELSDLLQDEEWEKMLADYGVFYFGNAEEHPEKKRTYPYMAAAMGAYGARYYKNAEIGRKVWESFGKELKEECSINGFKDTRQQRLVTCEAYGEIPWISTNVTAQWCLNVIVCLEIAKEYLPEKL